MDTNTALCNVIIANNCGIIIQNLSLWIDIPYTKSVYYIKN